MKKIIEIRLHGRGGQGTVTAAELIAVAAFYDGKFSQAFPFFGVERRGAPVTAYSRISDEFIRTREQIYTPDYVIVQDVSLMNSDPSVIVGLKKETVYLINSEKTEFSLPAGTKFFTVPATKIALEKIGQPFINTAILGAFCALSGLFEKSSVERAVRERFPKAIAEANIAALEAAYAHIKEK